MKTLFVSCFALIVVLAATPESAQAGRPYLYYQTAAFSRSINLSVAISRNELKKAGFENSSKPTAWEQFGASADTWVIVTTVPLSSSRTYVQVVATSNRDASAKRWSKEIMEAIRKSGLTPID